LAACQKRVKSVPAKFEFRELHLLICLVNLSGCGYFFRPDRAV
jgi:hypothetical protein